MEVRRYTISMPMPGTTSGRSMSNSVNTVDFLKCQANVLKNNIKQLKLANYKNRTTAPGDHLDVVMVHEVQ